MAKKITRDQLRHFMASDQQPYLVNTLNSLIDAARQNGFNIGGQTYQDQDGQQLRTRVRSRAPADWAQCVSLDNVDPFGIVEVYGGSYDQDTDEVILLVRKCTTVTPGLIWAGNESYDLYAGLPGWVRMVNPYAPVMVRTSGTVVFNDRVGISTTGNDFVQSLSAGYLRAVSDQQPTTNYAPVIKDDIIAPFVGKTTAAVAIGALGTVEVWSLPSGTTLTSSASLTDAGRTVSALFLYGGTTGAGKWVELTPHKFGIVATVITCPS
jgi:hypothetical protein